MQSNKGTRFFLRKSGRITGPFPLDKLNSMYRTGALTSQTMISEDKQNWSSISILFPALAPEYPLSQTAETPQKTMPVEKNLGKAIPVRTSAIGIMENHNCNNEVPAMPSGYTVYPVPEQHPVHEFFTDIGRTFALMWNFREIVENYAEKSARFYGIAIAVNVVLAAVFILLFGKYYSSRFSFLWSPLIGISLLVLLLMITSLAAWLVSANNNYSERRSLPSWMICAAGIFMNYGTFVCAVMALAHGVEQFLLVKFFLGFINTLILSSTIMQLRDYLETCRKNWNVPVFSAVLFLNPLFVATIYFFTKLI